EKRRSWSRQTRPSCPTCRPTRANSSPAPKSSSLPPTRRRTARSKWPLSRSAATASRRRCELGRLNDPQVRQLGARKDTPTRDITLLSLALAATLGQELVTQSEVWLFA